jgi:hypothetical protein
MTVLGNRRNHFIPSRLKDSVVKCQSVVIIFKFFVKNFGLHFEQGFPIGGKVEVELADQDRPLEEVRGRVLVDEEAERNFEVNSRTH